MNPVTTIVKKPAKRRIFEIPFMGVRGGEYRRNFYLFNITKSWGGSDCKSGCIPTLEATKSIQKRAMERGVVTRRLEWYEKSEGTNYGRGKLRGYLIYGISVEVILKSPKKKKEWRPGYRFWTGD